MRTKTLEKVFRPEVMALLNIEVDGSNGEVRFLTENPKSCAYALKFMVVYPVPASEMTYIVSGGALNSTHSLTHPVPATGTRFPRIAYRQSAINNSLAFKPTPNPNLTLPHPNTNP